MDSAHLRNRVAIVGAGFTNARRNTGLPVAALAIDASLAAIDDAGVALACLPTGSIAGTATAWIS